MAAFPENLLKTVYSPISGSNLDHYPDQYININIATLPSPITLWSLTDIVSVLRSYSYLS